MKPMMNVKRYLGASETQFKERFRNHARENIKSMRSAPELSKYI